MRSILGPEQAKVTFQITTSSSSYGSAYNVHTATIGTAGASSQSSDGSGIVYAANTTINQNETDYNAVFKTMSHEIGHSFGLDEETNGYGNSSGASTMASGPCGTPGDVNGVCGTEGPTQNDIDAVDCHSSYSVNSCGSPGDSHNPNCSCAGSCGDGLSCQNGVCNTCQSSCDNPSCTGYNANFCNCLADNTCAGECDDNGCGCTDSGKPGCPTVACENGEWTCLDSPIVIDVKGEGFRLTSASNGVAFDFFGDGSKVQVSWTDSAFSNAWLVLDRNGNGRIDNAGEMFGNITQQSPSDAPNGYLALAEYDKVVNGGNGNGFIDTGDAIYSKLRLWIDANHNGVSEPEELYTLDQWNVLRIGLTYQTRERTDRFGNVFRYRAEIWDRKGKTPDRWTYDVFLQQAKTK